MKIRRTVVLAACCTSLILGRSTASAVIFVTTSGNDNNTGTTWADAKRTVTAAAHASPSGGQVWVAAGTYIENVEIPRRVELYGGFVGNEDPNTFDLATRDFELNETILDGDRNGSVVRGGGTHVEEARIDGFTIRNGKGHAGGGIYVYYAKTTIVNNKIVDNESSYDGGGICIDLTARPATIVNNVIRGNRTGINGNGGGVYSGAQGSVIADNMIVQNTGGTGAGHFGGGVGCIKSGEVVGNYIAHNQATMGGGVYMRATSAPGLINANTLFANDDAGVYAFSNGPELVVAQNLVLANTGSGGVRCNSGVRLQNNTIVANTYSGVSYYQSLSMTNSIVAFNARGIVAEDDGPAVLLSNCVWGNTIADYDGIADPTGTMGNLSVDPQLADYLHGSMHLQPDSPCIDAGTNAGVDPAWTDVDGEARVQGAGVDIGADESSGVTWPVGPFIVVRVSPDGDDLNDGSSWSLAKQSVQAAIDRAGEYGGEVWVRDGIYPERIEVAPFVYVYGGFAGTETSRQARDWQNHNTIIESQTEGRVVTFGFGERVSALDGFSIQHTTAGGGIACVGASPRIAHNVISGHSTTGYGAGILCGGTTALVEYNTISGNHADLGGGGVRCSGSNATFRGNLVASNTSSRGGGFNGYSDESTFENNLVLGNSAVYGGGLYVEASGDPWQGPILANNTFVGNAGGSSGGAIALNGASLYIVNCVIAFNVRGILSSGLNHLTIRHNAVFGNEEGDYAGYFPSHSNIGENLDVNPGLLVTPDAGADGVWGTADDDWGDLRLAADSPCKDAGSNGYVLAAEDYSGAPRIAQCVVDLGAYENQDPSPIPYDYNRDCSVDIADYEILNACWRASGPGCTPPFQLCLDVFDGDEDSDIDLYDFAMFHLAYSQSREIAGK